MDITTRPRFTKARRNLEKCKNRRNAEYYIKALLHYVLTRQSSTIHRDDFLYFVSDLPNLSDHKKKTFISSTYDGMWGVFTKYPCNWASRFNLSILIREKRYNAINSTSEDEAKRRFYLPLPFTRQLLNHFPQFKNTWQHRPEGTYIEYKCSSQYYRYHRSQRTQRNLQSGPRPPCLFSLLPNQSSSQSSSKKNLLNPLSFYFDQVYEEIQNNIHPFQPSEKLNTTKTVESDDDESVGSDNFSDSSSSDDDDESDMEGMDSFIQQLQLNLEL